MTSPLTRDKLYMRREDLQNLPRHELPPPWSIRMYVPGDEQHWMRIHRAADVELRFSATTFDLCFGQYPQLLPERQLYLCWYERPVGTATAWFAEHPLPGTPGRVHWLAIHPDYQGRGLARPLLSATCDKLLSLHHSSAMLSTWSTRRRAIRLYLEFGFVPWARTPDDEKAWSRFQTG